MNKSTPLIKRYCLAALFFAIILSAIRTAALFLSYDAGLGYFDKSIISSLTSYLSVAYPACFLLVFLYVAKGKTELSFTPSSSPEKFGAVFAAVMFAFALFPAIDSLGAKKLTLLLCLTIPFSALFFILSLSKKSLHAVIRAYFSIVLIATLVITMALLYFDMSIAMNSPHKTLGSFILIAGMLFTLCELRIFIGKPAPRLQLFSGLVCFTLGISYSLSTVIYLLFASLDKFSSHPVMLGNFGYVTIILGISVYAFTRCLAVSQKSDTETEIAPVIEATIAEEE